MHGPYKEGFVYAMGNEIDALKKKQKWYIVPLLLVTKGKRVVKSMW